MGMGWNALSDEGDQLTEIPVGEGACQDINKVKQGLALGTEC